MIRKKIIDNMYIFMTQILFGECIYRLLKVENLSCLLREFFTFNTKSESDLFLYTRNLRLKLTDIQTVLLFDNKKNL